MEDQLRRAAETALHAPSIFNTQPWHWIIRGQRLELWADRSRQLRTVDPDGRLLTLSCGVALHHAEVALGRAIVNRLPKSDLMAVLSATNDSAPDPKVLAAIRSRRTDRRAFTAQPVSQADRGAIAEACEGRGAHFYVVRSDQTPEMTLSAVRAGAWQLSDAAYQAELMDWTGRPPWSGDGVPVESTVNVVPRRVPVRDFAPFRRHTTSAGPENDLGATYAVIFTDDDTPLSWLKAGEALSAVLLTATALNLGTAPISDVTEVADARDTLRRVIAPGKGHPQIAVRIGHSAAGDPPPRAPRRLADEVITAVRRSASPDAVPRC